MAGTTLKMEVAWSSATSERPYWTTRCHTAEYGNLQTARVLQLPFAASKAENAFLLCAGDGGRSSAPLGCGITENVSWAILPCCAVEHVCRTHGAGSTLVHAWHLHRLMGSHLYCPPPHRNNFAWNCALLGCYAASSGNSLPTFFLNSWNRRLNR